jgi:hypothetical protein
VKRVNRSPFGWAWAICLSFLALTANSEATNPESKVEAVIDALLKTPAPPPDWREHLRKRKERPARKPPPDAPISELANYWRNAPETEIPDDATRARLLEACEAAPDEIAEFLPRLALDSPEVQERLKKVYDRLVTGRGPGDAPRAQMVRDALMTHGNHFRDELVRRVFFPDDVTEPDFREATSAFLRLDREGAKQLFLKESTSSNLMHRVLALSNLHEHFAAKTNPLTPARWLDALKRIAADSKSARDPRRIALLCVMAEKNSVDDQWFLNLFHDRSLSEVAEYNVVGRSPTLLGDVVATRPDYWIPKIVPLVASKDPSVHANAVFALIQFQIENARADALRPLLPWLENPRWAPERKGFLGRLRLIQSLDRVELPEAVPGLLKMVETASEWELAGAAEALAHHNAREAGEPLKRALRREKEEHHRRTITRALLKLSALSVEEMVQDLKSFAEKISTAEGRKEIEASDDLTPKKQLDPRVSMGRELSQSELSDDRLNAELLAEAQRLSVTNPAAADNLRQFVAHWQTPSAMKAMADRLRSGELTAEWIKQLVEGRAKLSVPLAEVRDLNGTALGVQAGVTGRPELIQAVLSGNDPVATRALLAVARLGRVELPIGPVEELLTSSNKHLAKAAELYLEANDSAPAREALWLYSKNQARVLGYPHSSGEVWKGDISRSEAAARDLVLASGGPREIYALLSEGTWGGRGQALLLRYDTRIILRRDDGNGRLEEREVTPKEMDSLKEWIEREQIDDLPPFDTGTADGVQYEYLHLTGMGGRRVYMNNPPGANAAPRVEFGDQPTGPDPAIYGELTTRLESLSKPAMKVSYPALEKIPGYRIVHANEQGEINSIGMKNAKPAVSVRNHHNHSLEWHVLTVDGLSGDFTEEVAPSENSEPSRSDKAVSLEEGPLKGSVLLPDWSGQKRDDGLWAVTKNKKRELIARGVFSRPVVCPGGEWVVVAKTPNYDSWSTPNGVVRINLRSKQMFSVNLPPADNFDPLAWIAAHQRVLLYRQRDDPRYFGPSYEQRPDAGPEKPEFYLLEVPTGDHKRIEGEFRPLQRLEGHVLQPTGDPNEFWAIILEKEDDPKPTAVLGRYDTQQFRFTETLRFPDMWFHSWDCFVDAANHQVWLAVNGDLLRLALPDDSAPGK